MLNERGLDDTAATALADSLRTNDCVTSIELRKNRFTHIAVERLAPALAAHNIHRLDISQNRLGTKGGTALASVLTSSSWPALRTLIVNDCAVGDQGARAMCIALEVHYRLEELRLRGNGIGSIGASALAALLEVTNAVIIDLSWNNLSGKGALSLVTNIGPNYSLRECYLSHNGIDDHAAKSMLAELTTNSKLRVLDVSYNHITEQSCAVLFRELGEHSNLQQLKMDGNPIGRAGAQWLFRSKLAVTGCISIRECSMEVRRSRFDPCCWCMLGAMLPVGRLWPVAAWTFRSSSRTGRMRWTSVLSTTWWSCNS